MTKQLRFYGGSDDMFELEGDISEEIDCPSAPGIYHLKSAEGEMLVVAHYLRNGCWSIGIAQVDEEIPVPKWPVSYSLAHTYSVMLTIEVPDDIHLVTGEDDG